MRGSVNAVRTVGVLRSGQVDRILVRAQFTAEHAHIDECIAHQVLEHAQYMARILFDVARHLSLGFGAVQRGVRQVARWIELPAPEQVIAYLQVDVCLVLALVRGSARGSQTQIGLELAPRQRVRGETSANCGL